MASVLSQIPDLSEQMRALFESICDVGVKDPKDMDRLMKGVEITCAIQDKPKLMAHLDAILKFVKKEDHADATEAVLDLVHAVIVDMGKQEEELGGEGEGEEGEEGSPKGNDDEIKKHLSCLLALDGLHEVEAKHDCEQDANEGERPCCNVVPGHDL